MDVESKTYTVSFDKHKMQVPQILSAVMELTEVTDIKLQETELAEIVKEITTNNLSNLAFLYLYLLSRVENI